VAQRLQIVSGNRQLIQTPFEFFYGTGVPDNGTGSNGDFYFRYDNGTAAIYKKVSGVWIAAGGASSSGYSGEQEFAVTTSNVTEFVYAAGFEDTDKIDVYIAGVRKFEGASRDWVRTSATDKVTFNSGISGTVGFPTYVVIRKW